MKFTTIWSIPAMSFKERLRRTRDWAAMTVGAHLPLRIRYFSAIGMIAKSIPNDAEVPAVPLETILKNLPAPKNIA